MRAWANQTILPTLLVRIERPTSTHPSNIRYLFSGPDQCYLQFYRQESERQQFTAAEKKKSGKLQIFSQGKYHQDLPLNIQWKARGFYDGSRVSQ
jgi:hypothetical protein